MAPGDDRMWITRYWLLMVAIIAGIACGRALHAEDIDSGESPSELNTRVSN